MGGWVGGLRAWRHGTRWSEVAGFEVAAELQVARGAGAAAGAARGARCADPLGLEVARWLAVARL
eukprot:COSAG02_NODE_60350_length_271_cov_1.162791_1_plen_64_part_10